MEFLLNERSLYGQFNSMDDFLKSLKPLVKCIKIIRNFSNMGIYKTCDFHECKITKDKKICDLNLNGMSDELMRFKLSLDQEIYNEPYWDREPVHDVSQEFLWNNENFTSTSLAEAVITKNSLLSFQSENFNDCVLTIVNNKKSYYINSIHTPKYLLEQYGNILKTDKKHILLI